MRKISLFKTGTLAAGALAAVWLLAGCSSSIYRDQNNWAVIENDIPAFFAEYDLIFLYPSQEQETKGGHMNWLSGSTSDWIRRYVNPIVTSQFGPRVRVFSPYVPMLGFREYMAILDEYRKERDRSFDFYKTSLRVPIDSMVEALDTYFSCYHNKKYPFVIYGQGQGALILYEAMKRCSKVSPDNGFVAAYFFGVPGVHSDEIASDFGGRGIRAATRPDEVGVVAICNARLEGAPLETTLALPNGAVVNPLNWLADATPAGAELNPGAMFVDRKEPNPANRVKVVPKFCGATVDPENGVINITGVKKSSEMNLEEYKFDSNIWGLFVRSVSLNAHDRVRMYKYLLRGVKLREE